MEYVYKTIYIISITQYLINVKILRYPKICYRFIETDIFLIQILKIEFKISRAFQN